MLSKWIELIAKLGPKFGEILPLILELLRIFNGLAPGTVSPSYSIHRASQAAPVSPEYQKFVDEAVKNGADEELAKEFAHLVEEKDNG